MPYEDIPQFQEYKEQIIAAHREAMNRNPNANAISEFEKWRAETYGGKPLTRREAMEEFLASDASLATIMHAVLNSGSTIDEYVDDVRNGRTPAFEQQLNQRAKQASKKIKKPNRNGPRL